MKKLFITGGEGFLGSRLAQHYQNHFHVSTAGHSDLDIADEPAVMDIISRLYPDVVIHCAAISNTNTCEQQPELSKSINEDGAVNIAKACKKTGGKLIFMSSDQIYAGSSHLSANKESDVVPPINVYGKHKQQAETKILELLPDSVCLRLTWLYDLPVKGLKTNSNMLCNVINSIIQDRPITLASNDYRGITWSQAVVEQMEAAMKLPGGVYNFGSESSWSSYELGVYVFKLLGGKKESLIIKDEDRYANAPRNLTMDLEKLKKEGISFPDTKEGFKICLEKNRLIQRLMM